mgnify:FL=1|tara:strand:- start:2571 stop:3305 length:735 start_codon:yes stop_codon:yes gene_type:complete
MKKILFILGCFCYFQLPIIALDVVDLLKKVDEKYNVSTQLIESRMIVYSRRGKREMKLKTYTFGTSKSFSEYLAPPRDKGIKMLRIENDLWTYTPMADRVIKISGHMLRQSVMGSDFSYEDMLERDLLGDNYNAILIGSETLFERACYIIELNEKEPGLAYPKRKVWIDKERYIALKEERFAKSGILLKKTEVIEVMKIDDTWYPKKMVFKDMLKKGQGTHYYIDSLTLNLKLPDNLFTKSSLR